jgi:hypothetical protein
MKSPELIIRVFPKLYAMFIDINNIYSNTTQLIILLKYTSYIVSFNDIFRL